MLNWRKTSKQGVLNCLGPASISDECLGQAFAYYSNAIQIKTTLYSAGDQLNFFKLFWINIYSISVNPHFFCGGKMLPQRIVQYYAMLVFTVDCSFF